MKSLVQSIAAFVFRSRLFAKWVFRLEFGPIGVDDHYCDAVTLVLLQKVCKELSPAVRVLDMGTGAVAVIGLTLWKRLGCKVTACDINPEIVALAQENVRRNGAPIRVICSRFFERVDEPFDVVTFDPPYVSTKAGVDANLPERRRSQWDGGADGAEVVAGFMAAFRMLDHKVKAYLGINYWHISRERILKLFGENRGGISIHEVYRHPILPVDVYVFTNIACPLYAPEPNVEIADDKDIY